MLPDTVTAQLRSIQLHLFSALLIPGQNSVFRSVNEYSTSEKSSIPCTNTIPLDFSTVILNFTVSNYFFLSIGTPYHIIAEEQKYFSICLLQTESHIKLPFLATGIQCFHPSEALHLMLISLWKPSNSFTTLRLTFNYSQNLRRS